MKKISGWLLDLYTDPQQGKTHMWVIERSGKRTCVSHPFPGIFYFSSNDARKLQQAENFLYNNFSKIVRVTPEYQQHTILPTTQRIFAVHTPSLLTLRRVFSEMERTFPEFDYYNVDLNATHYYAAYYGTFSLCLLDLDVDEQNRVSNIKVKTSQWDLEDDEKPALRILNLIPDTNPNLRAPAVVTVQDDSTCEEILFKSYLYFVNRLAGIINEKDPDILLTQYGDGSFLQKLWESSQQLIHPLALNRVSYLPLRIKKESTYHSYGQTIYRPQGVMLYGRQHIDLKSSHFWSESGLVGLLEVARVTGQTLQQTARTTPGTGISSMQIIEALRSNILVPYKKQEPERPRTALNLLQHDMGGFHLKPILGLHEHVGAIDFISMYPSLMVYCNISPEKEPHGLDESHDDPGLIPRTLKPLLEKRIQLKMRVLGEDSDIDEETRQTDKMRSDALKWLLVTCFGYLGYRNARFGRIESHEAVTGVGRETLLRGKEVAEEYGFRVLHALVDSLFIQNAGCEKKEDFEPLLDEIMNITGIPIALDGVFRWCAFPESRTLQGDSVSTRYFGVFQDGSIKVRGIEARRRDTPAFIKATQLHVLEILAQAETLDAVRDYLPEAFRVSAEQRQKLATCQVPVEELVVTAKLSKKLEDYTVKTPAYIAAQELVKNGTPPQPGQLIHFVHTKGKMPARLWQPDCGLMDSDVDARLYLRMYDRAIETVLGLFEQRFPDVLPRNYQYILSL